MPDKYSNTFAEYRPDDPLHGAAFMERRWAPSLGEYAGASMAQMFDRTSGVRLHENMSIRIDEGRSIFDAAANDGAFGDLVDTGGGEVSAELTKEQYEASPHYREKVPYEPGMTETRARIYAENFDKRRERERIIAAGDANGPWYYKAIGFGAGLIGSLPDPVNLIPFVGGAAKGASLAGMSAKEVLAQSLRIGAIEGAAANLASSTVAALDLNRKGEDIGFQDVMLETMFGAVAGPLFHGAGAFLGRRSARKSIRSGFESLRDALPEGMESSEIARAVESMKKGVPEAYGKYGKLFEEFGGGPERLRATSDYIRERVTPQERMELARAMELALHDLTEGRPVDVAPVLRDSAIMDQMENLAGEYASGFQETDAATFIALREKSKRPEFLTPYTAEEMKGWKHFITEDGAGFTLTDKMDIIGVVNNSGKKGAGIDAVIEAIARGGETLDCIDGNLKEYYQAFGFVENRAKRMAWDDQHAPKGWNYDKYGRPDIFFFEYPAGLSRDRGDIRRRFEAVRGEEPGGGSLGSEVGREVNQQADSRIRSGLDTPESHPFDRGTGASERNVASDSSLSPIAHETPFDGVSSFSRLDWRTESPESHAPLLPEPQEVPHILHETGIDPQTGISPEEAALAHLEAEGRLSQADREAFLAHTAESERINALEENALSIAACVMEVA